MVLLHTMRAARFVARGYLSPKKGIFDETVVNVYAGWRMVDTFGHINNSRYLEICEFGRWHQGGQQRSFQQFRDAMAYPVVGAVHVQFMKEIKPAKVVQVRTKVVHFDERSWLVRQHVMDKSGKTLHATCLFRLSFLNTKKSVGTDGESRKGPSSLTSVEIIQRLGMDPVAVRKELEDAWEHEVKSSDVPPATTDEVVLPTESRIVEASKKVIDDVNDLDVQWRGLLRQMQINLRGGASKRKK